MEVWDLDCFLASFGVFRPMVLVINPRNIFLDNWDYLQSRSCFLCTLPILLHGSSIQSESYMLSFLGFHLLLSYFSGELQPFHFHYCYFSY